MKKCVEIKGDYVEKQQSCFISVTLKKVVRPETFGPYYAFIDIRHSGFLASNDKKEFE